MADFYGTMKKVQDNVSVTENGMTGYKTTYHPLLDMNFKISSYRHSTDEQIRQDIDKILAEQEDAKYLLKFLSHNQRHENVYKNGPGNKYKNLHSLNNARDCLLIAISLDSRQSILHF